MGMITIGETVVDTITSTLDDLTTIPFLRVAGAMHIAMLSALPA
jgi:hypothetical protein